ncbi:hypothetical protein A0K93_07865 [Corynebacterium sp. BCW_4722]|nr:hypothetical protein A0K93_07865 [Corynebacterium sp. BCW_4722]
MNTSRKAAAVIAAVATLAPVTAPAALAGPFRPLPPGARVPYDPGYTGYWVAHDVVKLGDKNYFNRNVEGVRIVGKFSGTEILCVHNKGGMQECFVDGKTVTDLGYSRSGRVLTVDPLWATFAPVIRFIHQVSTQSFNLTVLSS